MKVVDSKSCTSQNYTDFSTEASTIGLKPGEWPDTLEFHDANKVHKLYYSSAITEYGEVLCYIYNDMDLVSLKIYND